MPSQNSGRERRWRKATGLAGGYRKLPPGGGALPERPRRMPPFPWRHAACPPARRAAARIRTVNPDTPSRPPPRPGRSVRRTPGAGAQTTTHGQRTQRQQPGQRVGIRLGGPAGQAVLPLHFDGQGRARVIEKVPVLTDIGARARPPRPRASAARYPSDAAGNPVAALLPVRHVDAGDGEAVRRNGGAVAEDLRKRELQVAGLWPGPRSPS